MSQEELSMICSICALRIGDEGCWHIPGRKYEVTAQALPVTPENELRCAVLKLPGGVLEVILEVGKMTRFMPPDMLQDPERMTTWMNNCVTSVKQVVARLREDDIFVHTDAIVLRFLTPDPDDK